MKFRNLQKKVSLNHGVALLKVDDDVKLFQSPDGGAGYCIGGGVVHAPWNHHMVIKARLDAAPCDPAELRGMKVWYRFYVDEDRFGKRRPYLQLMARSDDAPYSGHRLVIISRDQVWLVPDLAWREKMRAIREKEGLDLEAPLSYAELLQAQFDACA